MNNADNSVNNSTLTNSLETIKATSLKTICQIIWRASLACFGSAVQLEIKRASQTESGQKTIKVFGRDEITDVSTVADTSAFDSRLRVVHWVATWANVPAEVVEREAHSACLWLLNRPATVKTADLEDLEAIGLDQETIDAGRAMAAKWESKRGEERGAITQSIGASLIREISDVYSVNQLEPNEVGLAVELLGKAVHSAMVTATAKVDASSWSPRRKAEALADLAQLVTVRSELEVIDVTDSRDLIDDGREVW